jgi:hypothetical protein
MEMATSLNGVYTTGSGMLCVWNPDAFAGVADYDSWERELCEDKDILRHIIDGAFVPVGIHRGLDGAFGVHLRVGNSEEVAKLTEREAMYVLGHSEPYLFKTSGQLCLGGLEQVEGHPGSQVGQVTVPEGEYAVWVYLLAWDDEPGMKDSLGRPKPEALPDFVVLVNPKPNGIQFRQQVRALDPPSKKPSITP